MQSSSRVDTQQQRLLDRLREAEGRAVTFAELHAGGIDFPAAVAGELELAGYAVERVYQRGTQIGVRLLEPERADVGASSSRRRWRWIRRHDPPAQA